MKMPEGKQAVLELEAVWKWFDSICAVQDLSLGIPSGEFFAILGPSGCGKSTTLRMIGGLEDPTTGSIRIRGQDMARVPPYHRPTNMVFQQLALFPHLNVFDNIAFGLRVQRLPRPEIEDRVGQILGLVQLPGMEGRRVRELSGGQQQRVALARALVNEPAVLLLDEPLGALDLKLRMSMQIELKLLQRKLGMTFVYVTHDQGEALVLADRIGVMNRGRMEQVGSGFDLYMHPATSFVADFVGETNLLRGRISEAVGQRAVFYADGLSVTILVPSGLQVQAGQNALLSLRPESLLVGTDADEARNRFTARIEKLTFLGPTVRCDVDLDGLRLSAHLPARLGTTMREGQPTRVGWEEDAGVLVVE